MIEVYCQLSWYYSRLLMYSFENKIGNYRDIYQYNMVFIYNYSHSPINIYYMLNQKMYD